MEPTKTVVVFAVNEEGKQVKITRTIRRTLVKIHASKAVLQRKKEWVKFGEAKGLPAGPEPGVTRFGEELDVRFAPINKDSAKEEKKAAPQKSKTIVCRICKGDHWTTKCPYKGTLEPMESGFPGMGETPTSTGNVTLVDNPKT